MKVKIKKLRRGAIVPTYGTDGAACFDLYACGIENRSSSRTFLKYRTGLAFEVPPGYVMMIYSRSGLASSEMHARLANCVGVVDSDYRGEVIVMLKADGRDFFQNDIFDGDRIAQAMIVPVDRVEFDVVDELSDTARGAGGFGSTGK